MKSMEYFRRVVVGAALVGAGILGGLALGWAIFSFNLGSMGIAAIFANAIGAAVGAAITLEVAERRMRQAEEKANAAAAKQKYKALLAAVADLSLLRGNLGFLADQIHKGEIDGSSATAWLVVDQRVKDRATFMRFLLDAELVEHYTSLAFDLPHVERIVAEVRGGKVTKGEMDGDIGATIANELRKTAHTIDAALAALKAMKL